jgi:hypothetical protein
MEVMSKDIFERMNRAEALQFIASLKRKYEIRE